MKFEVPLVYIGNLSYIVEAPTKEIAERIARDRFMKCDLGDIPVIEEEWISKVGEIKEI